MKIIILVIIGLVLLGGGGFFGYKFFTEGLMPWEVFIDPEKAREEKAPTLALDIHYIEMEAINISIVRNRRVERIYSAFIVLEVDGEKNKAVVEAAMPKIRDAFLTYLHALGALSEVVDISNTHITKYRLQAIANDVLQEDIVRAVLIQSAFDRRV